MGDGIMKRFHLILGLAVMLATVGTAWAHPHIWIDATVRLDYRDGLIHGIEVHWTFDEFYTELVVPDFDSDGSGELDQDELAAMAAQSHEALKELSYFTFFLQGGAHVGATAATDMRAAVTDGLLKYSFMVPLPEAVDLMAEGFGFALYDPTYYVDITLPGFRAIRVTADWPQACGARLVEDEDNPIYFGMVNPLVVDIQCQGV